MTTAALGIVPLSLYACAESNAASHPALVVKTLDWAPMQFDNSRLDIATLNLRKGRYDAAFDIFFELAVNDFDQEAQFALTKMCFDGHLDPEQINKLFAWVNSNSSIGEWLCPL